MENRGVSTLQFGYELGLVSINSVTHKPIQGGWVVLSVSDTGAGIEEEILDKVFDPFFTTKDVDKGTGMGLSVIFGILQSCQGHVQVISQVGIGTTVRTFPAGRIIC